MNIYSIKFLDPLLTAAAKVLVARCPLHSGQRMNPTG